MARVASSKLKGRMLFVLPITDQDLDLAGYLEQKFRRIQDTGIVRVYLLRAN